MNQGFRRHDPNLPIHSIIDRLYCKVETEHCENFIQNHKNYMCCRFRLAIQTGNDSRSGSRGLAGCRTRRADTGWTRTSSPLQKQAKKSSNVCFENQAQKWSSSTDSPGVHFLLILHRIRVFTQMTWHQHFDTMPRMDCTIIMMLSIGHPNFDAPQPVCKPQGTSLVLTKAKYCIYRKTGKSERMCTELSTCLSRNFLLPSRMRTCR